MAEGGTTLDIGYSLGTKIDNIVPFKLRLGRQLLKGLLPKKCEGKEKEVVIEEEARPGEVVSQLRAEK